MKKIKNLHKIFLVSSLSFLILACSDSSDKKSQKATTQQKVENTINENSDEKCIFKQVDLSKKITDDAPIFAVWNTSSKQYLDAIAKFPDKFKSLDFEAMASEGGMEKGLPIIKKILKVDKLNATTISSKGVFFIEEVKENSMPMALYFEFTNDIDKQELFDGIKTLAKERKIDVSEISIAGEKALKAVIKSEFNENDDIYFYITSKNNQIACTNKTSLIERFLDDKYDSQYIKKLFDNNEGFKKSILKITPDDRKNYFTAGLFLNSKFQPTNLNIKEFKYKIPFSSIVMAQNFKYDKKLSLTYEFASEFKAKNDEQKEIKNSLENIKREPLLDYVPQNTILNFGLNTKLLLDIFRTNIPKDEYKEFDKIFKIKSLKILALEPEAGMMFPNLAIVGEDIKDPSQISEELKKIFSKRLKNLPANSLIWQKKKIANLDTEYLITPFNVGIFMAKNDNNLYLTTSEKTLLDLFSKDSKKNAKIIREKFAFQSSPIANIYVSSKNFAKTLNMLSGAFGMFVQPKDMKNIKDLATSLASAPDATAEIYFDDDLIVSKSTMILE